MAHRRGHPRCRLDLGGEGQDTAEACRGERSDCATQKQPAASLGPRDAGRLQALAAFCRGRCSCQANPKGRVRFSGQARTRKLVVRIGPGRDDRCGCFERVIVPGEAVRFAGETTVQPADLGRADRQGRLHQALRPAAQDRLARRGTTCPARRPPDRLWPGRAWNMRRVACPWGTSCGGDTTASRQTLRTAARLPPPAVKPRSRPAMGRHVGEEHDADSDIRIE